MPKPENVELIAKLESAIAGLTKFDWEWPFGTILWEVDSQGAFSIEKLFEFRVIPEKLFLESYSIDVL